MTTMSELDRYNQAVYSEIEQTVNVKDLPKTIAEQAKSVYSEFISHQDAWSRPKEHFAIACIYHVIRSEHLPYALQDLSEGKEISNLLNTFRKVCSETEQFPPVQEPEVFIDRIHDRLQMDDQTASRAKKIINKQPAETLSGKQPNALAAGSYYLAMKQSKYKITQATISEVVNVSSATIRKRYTELAEGV